MNQSAYSAVIIHVARTLSLARDYTIASWFVKLEEREEREEEGQEGGRERGRRGREEEGGGGV